MRIEDDTLPRRTTTTYSVATDTQDGLMSSQDHAKLASIASGANNYTLPVASSTTYGGVKINGWGLAIGEEDGITNVAVGKGLAHDDNHQYIEVYTGDGLVFDEDESVKVNCGAGLTIDDEGKLTVDSTATASSDSAGLMSSTDKSKLDSLGVCSVTDNTLTVG